MMATADDKFEDLLRYYPAVCRFLVRMGFADEDARDLAQDTFARVYQHLDSYRGDSRWSYLKTTARNIALNAARSRSTAKRSVAEFALDDPYDAELSGAYAIPDGSNPYEELAEREEAASRQAQLATAITHLPEGARETLLLYLAGFSYNDIARAMNVTLDAVKSRLKDARRILISLLDEHER